MKRKRLAALFLMCALDVMAAEPPYTLRKVVYSKAHALKGYLARPKGRGPFPAVIYHHGGLGRNLGGCPKETSIALAKAGYVGFSPLRRKTRPMADAIEDARAAMTFIQTLDYVDRNRLGVIGFSRGGHLAFYDGAGNARLKALVVMACAPGRRNRDKFFFNVRKVKASVLLLVAKNDNVRADLVALMKKIKQMLDKERKDARLVIYPPYKTDGHRMFFTLGDYWQDVVNFLKKKLGAAGKPEAGGSQ